MLLISLALFFTMLYYGWGSMFKLLGFILFLYAVRFVFV